MNDVWRSGGDGRSPIRLGRLAPILLLSLVLPCRGETINPVWWSAAHFSPDGTRLAAVRNGGGVSEFALPRDPTGRDVALPFDRLQCKVVDLNYDASGDLLVLCHVTNSLSVWNTRKGVVAAHRPLHASPLGGRLAREGRRAVVCFEGTPGNKSTSVALINWEAGGAILPLPEHRGILSLALSGDGKRLATLDGDRIGRIWDTGTAALVLTLPSDTQKGVGIVLDAHGDAVAVVGANTLVQHVDQTQHQAAVAVPNAAPKATTLLGGIGIILLEVPVSLVGNTAPEWNPHWFKSAPLSGLCLSDDGKRIAMIHSAPNLKGGFQIRLADARTGCPEVVRGLSKGFIPSGQPVFSPNGLQVAVPGNGVRVLEFPPSPTSKLNDLWLAKNRPDPSPVVTQDRHEIHYWFEVKPVGAPHSVSSLARAPRRRVCVEATASASGTESWVIPLGLGMKNVFTPNKPVSLLMNEALRSVWQGCGQELVRWDEELDLSSTITKWQLDAKRSFSKGWDLTATIEIELSLKDRTGTVLHTARYAGADHQTKLWEPSASFIANMHARTLNACLAETRNDPKWEQVLATAKPVVR